ncbi:1,4-dihydroxy-2-naphthoate octaprenyltransferase [Fictibacillus sp. WQ 8-8]|uniref:1,4-dihydroxy-2-naphthoate octaprenyltransferase n=1 Tax=unclassified Fictibacillus TaxID=2644029 RepID=UPI0007860CD5|nr:MULTISPECIES: 1,4-dihydroxy-2-naphthoate octaprenyltransferase [unclassified Fictibacillus]MCQ6266368.1 1,4-dihydroxy-2-naphthoate octaprenyltransferase [Fictibacillus sp. WQ 8-8]UZJ80492.1 1,4-dihydroxy-2-naphthoate octaprenyltransferase [Fictibacillus sp. KU28468]
MISPKTILASTRPFSLTASIIPVLFGTILAMKWTEINWGIFLLTLAGAIFMQCGTNLVNDYFDYKKGADQPGSLSPSGVIDRKEMTPVQVHITGLIFFALGSIIGLILASLTGSFILYIGIPSLLIGYFYTATRYALAYNGFGEFASGTTLGVLAVIGSYYVQTLTVHWETVLISLPNAFLIMAILHANNLRDIDTDKLINKITIAGLIGKKGARIEYYILMLGTYIILLLLVIASLLPAWSLIAIVSLPIALKAVGIAARTWEPKELNKALGLTAMLHLGFGLLLCIGTFIGISI